MDQNFSSDRLIVELNPNATASETTNSLAETKNVGLPQNSLLNTLNSNLHLAACSCEGCSSLVINKYPIAPAPVLGATVSLASLPFLSSNPSARSKIFLDFDGHTTSGTSWNTRYNGGANIFTPAYSLDADTTTFSIPEVASIEEIWKRVSEDYAPFNVDVTTIDPGNLNEAYNIRVVIGGSWDQWFGDPAGGVAYVNSWKDSSSDLPVFVFEDNLANGAAKATAECISHEVGHSLGLNHQTTYDAFGNPLNQGYNPGFGSGDTGWAPIMGVSYGQNLTTWHNGTSGSGATTYQDDMSIISAANNGFGGYRTDDHGNTISSATPLSGTTTLTGSGIITQTSDIDVFSFQAGAGPVDFTINPAQYGPNLDVLAELINSSGTVIASSNPSDNLFANLNTSVSAGTYFVSVKSNGQYGRVGQYTISGTVASDTTPPTASSFTPVDNATGVAVAANLVVNFSEAIQKGTGNIVIKKLSDNSIVETIAVTAANITVSGSQLTINPTVDLAQGTDYYVEVANGAIKDIAGNNYAGITGNSTWNFTTTGSSVVNDNLANRIVLSGVPVSRTGSNIGATGEVGEPSQNGVTNSVWWSWTAPSSSTFVVDTKASNFDTYLSLFTGSAVNNLNLIASDDDGGGNYTSLINLNATAGTTYQIAVDGYQSATGSIQLNIAPAADITPPTASSFTPADNATGVAVGANLVVNFSEAIQKGTGNIVIEKLSDNSVVEIIPVSAANISLSGSQLTINPTADLAPNTDYYVEVSNGAIKDLAGNNYAGITGNSTWNFKTLVPSDTTPPTASSFTPVDNATGVAVAANLVVNFSEAIQKGTGNIVIKKLSDNSIVETIAVTAANITVSGSQLTINPTADLAQGTDYYVEVANGAIKDIAGNNYAGITGNSTWNFTTTGSNVVNDNLANRIVLTGVPVSRTGSNIGATGEVGEPSQNGVTNSVWWSWTAPSSSTFVVDTKGSNFDTYLSLFTGSAANNLNLIASDDDGGGNYTSLINLNATAGTTYQIAVDGYQSATGSIQLNIAATASAKLLCI